MVESAEKKLELLITIMDAYLEDSIIDIFEELGVAAAFMTYGSGTVKSKVHEMLGYGGPKKLVSLAIMTGKMSEMAMDSMDSEIDLSRPGTGIALSISLSSISKKLSDISLKAEETLQVDEDSHKGSDIMLRAQQEPFQLIIAVVNSGHFDLVMEAAKGAGAKGGTVVHARSLGSKEAVKYLGITVQPEKDLVLILSRKENRLPIMEAITHEAGLHSDAAGVCFSLPVNDVVGVGALIDNLGPDTI